ncbi:hypothetical protein D3C85_1425340 [compost metagenome]
MGADNLLLLSHFRSIVIAVIMGIQRVIVPKHLINPVYLVRLSINKNQNTPLIDHPIIFMSLFLRDPEANKSAYKSSCASPKGCSC